MVKSSFINKIELTRDKVNLHTKNIPGIVILFNKEGKIKELIIADKGIKNCLLQEIEKESASYFIYREVEADLFL